MTDAMQYKGYAGSVAYDTEDKLYHGRLIGIRDFVLYDGDDLQAVEENFRGAVDDYLQNCIDDNKEPDVPFSILPLKVRPEVHKRAYLFAKEHKIEFNALVEKALSDYLAHAS